MMPLSVWPLAACLAVSAVSDQIRAGDLAPASPAFAALDPGTVVGWAPAPGVRRVFGVAELRRMAARLGAAPAPQAELCVERPVAPLDRGRILAALETQVPGGEIKLLDFSRAPAPEGELVFPRTGLRSSRGAAVWNGYVRYAETRRFAVWAKVALAVPAVVAAVDLLPGRPIEAAQLRLEPRGDLGSVLGALEQAVGQCPRRAIRAGTVISPRWLEPAPEIRRGDPVAVDIWSGGAHLMLDARAESAAGLGQRVAVRNPATQKRFFARVDGKGRVSVGSAGPGEKP